MLDSLKAASTLAALMKNKDAFKQSGQRVKLRLAEIRAAGGSGGGAVRATVSGDMRVISVDLDPAVCACLAASDANSRAYVQQLIVEAVNNACDIAKAMAQREIAKEAEALGLPTMPGIGDILGG